MAKRARRDSDGNEIRSERRNSEGRYKFEYEGFVRSDMEKADRQACDVFAPTTEDMDSWLVKRTEGGFHLKIGIKSDGSGISASLMCADTQHDWCGWILSAFADNWHDALRILMYKDTVMFQAGWELGMSGTKQRTTWG